MSGRWRMVGSAAALVTALSLSSYGANAQGVDFQLNSMKSSGVAGDFCDIFYDVVNNSEIYIGRGFASTVIRDKDGRILDKGGVRFGRTKPHETVAGEDLFYNIDCRDVTSIQVVLTEVTVAGDLYTYDKVPKELLGGKNSSLIIGVNVK